MISWAARSRVLPLRDTRPYTVALKATERNIEAAREGTIVLTHKLLGLARRNANTALNLITKSLNAKSFAVAAYWFTGKNKPNLAFRHAPIGESCCGDVPDDLNNL